jgi:hypothetical protein
MTRCDEEQPGGALPHEWIDDDPDYMELRSRSEPAQTTRRTISRSPGTGLGVGEFDRGG